MGKLELRQNRTLLQAALFGPWGLLKSAFAIFQIMDLFLYFVKFAFLYFVKCVFLYLFKCKNLRLGSFVQVPKSLYYNKL